MTKGFYSMPVLGPKRPSGNLLPKCGACGLFRKCSSPKMKVSGKGRRKILVVGDYPGKVEDDIGRPFVGESGQFLEQQFLKYGVDLREDCWLTNALICRPRGEVKDEKLVGYCRPNLLRAMDELQPEIVLLLGARAVESLIGHVWKEDTKGITRWLKYTIPCQKPNVWIVCSFNPAYLIRNEREANYSVLEMIFNEHLRTTSELSARPWKEVPNYDSKARWTCSQEEACSVIRKLQENKKPVAFDYETNMVRPDSDRARILSCAVSDGNVTVAYPWLLETAQATSRLLADSSVPKVGYSIKFENRWTRKLLGHPVRNWIHDGLLASHFLDSTRGTKGLKFQAFARLGFGDYSEKLKPYMESKGMSQENRLKDAPLPELLKYNALDAYLEYKIYVIQKGLVR